MPSTSNGGTHAGSDLIDNRLVQHCHDFHVVQVWQIKQWLALAHRQAGFDEQFATGIIGVDDESVVRGTNGAVFDLLLERGQPVIVAGNEALDIRGSPWPLVPRLRAP